MRRDLPLLSDKKAKAILEAVCKDQQITLDLLVQLIEIQRDNLGRGRQLGISQEFAGVIQDFLEAELELADVSD